MSQTAVEAQIEKIAEIISRLKKVGQDDTALPGSGDQFDQLVGELAGLVTLLAGANHTADDPQAELTGPIATQPRLNPKAGETERKYEFIVNTSKELMTLIDRHYIYEAVNEAYCQARNKPRSAVVGRTVAEVWGEQRFQQIVKAKLDECFTGREVHYQDWFEFHALGLRCFDVAYYPYRDASGQVTHVVVVSRDVTERKQVEFAHQEIEERYRRFFEEDLAGDFIATPTGSLLACNPAFARIFGFESPTDALQHNLADLFPDEQAWWRFYEYLLAQQKVESYEIELRHRHGQTIYVLANVIGTFNQAGVLHEIKGYLFDNTERKELEEQFRQSQKMEAIGSLAGGIAHDFNNLTTIITGYSELILRSLEANHSLKEDLEEIKRAGEQAALLTRQLLAFSRKQILRPRILNLDDVVVDVERMLRRLIGEDIELIVPHGQLIGYVRADRSQIEQVIVNLVLNARDAMPQGGKLSIRTENVVINEAQARHQVEVQPGPYACLIVEDSGIGMTAEIQEHIFEPFFTTKEPGKGTGLGLSSAYGTIKQSGGHITVTSHPDAGATFKVFLPLVTEEEALEVGHGEDSAELAGTETILLVEDEPGVRGVIRRLLEVYGYQVVEAQSGTEALHQFESYDGPIHLVVSDVVLPGGMNGYHLIERLVASYPKTKALLLSGYTDRFHMTSRALNSDMPFLQKPFALNTFIRMVRALLDR